MSIQPAHRLTVCLLLLAASAPAVAHDREGAYVFAGFGSASTAWKARPGVTPAGQDPGSTSSNRSYQLGAGYRFNDYLGVEANYADMTGQARRAGIGAVQGSAFGVGAVGILPLGRRIELFAKAGVGRSQHRFQRAADAAGPSSVRGYNVSPLVSLGANYRVNSTLAMRVEWSTVSRYSDAFRDAIGAESLTTGQWTVGLSYRF